MDKPKPKRKPGRPRKHWTRTKTEKRIAELAVKIHPKRLLFLEHWLAGVAECSIHPPSRKEAARKAGYFGNEFTLSKRAASIMENPDCQEYIALRLRQAVSPEDVVMMLSEHAMGDYNDICEEDPETGKPIPTLSAARKSRKMHLIQDVEFKKGVYVPKMYSSQAALFKLADIYIASAKRKGIDPQELLDMLPDVYMHEGHAFPLKEIFTEAILANVEEDKALPGR